MARRRRKRRIAQEEDGTRVGNRHRQRSGQHYQAGRDEPAVARGGRRKGQGQGEAADEKGIDDGYRVIAADQGVAVASETGFAEPAVHLVRSDDLGRASLRRESGAGRAKGADGRGKRY